ncbi:ABC transporter ATP-binding protein [Hwanghaeella sp.]|uniref:ABC transporter ATP-binding protein n=1 Tax=Hwanghaeella sp. TaxID=2605943 RepID=UPI003CCBD125
MTETTNRRFGLSEHGLAFVRDHIRNHAFQFGSLFVLSFIGAVIEMTGVGLIFPLLIILVAPEKLSLIPELEAFINSLNVSHATLGAILIIIIAIVMVGKNGFMLAFNWFTAQLLARWKTALSRRLMGMYLFSDYSTHLVKTSSEIIRNLSLTASVFDQFFFSLIQLIVNISILLGLCALLVSVLPASTQGGLLLICGTAAVLYFVMRKPFHRIGEELNELYQRRQAVMRQSIGMIRETKLTAREAYFLDVFGGIEETNFKRQAFNRVLNVVPPLVTESAVIVAVLAIISQLLLFSGDEDLGLALLGLMAATFFRLTPVLNRILTSLQVINFSRNSIEIISAELHSLEPATYQPTIEPDALPFEREITLKDVGYTYPSSEVKAVKQINLSIGNGESLGITGASGAGKSTLIALIMGLVPPSEGEMRIDDVPLDTPARLRAWQRHIGFVPQGIFLMDDTIARNVAFASDEIDDDLVWKTLEVVQMAEYVRSLPDGIYSQIGEEGARLSGGQRQRLGIARSLYMNPNILICDEATSALDSATERAFMDSLEELRGQHTLIMIAHRISTLKNCDRIVMMDGGRILDVAPFDELRQRCPEFDNLVRLSMIQESENQN